MGEANNTDSVSATHTVMSGLGPDIHVFVAGTNERRGCRPPAFAWAGFARHDSMEADHASPYVTGRAGIGHGQASDVRSSSDRIGPPPSCRGLAPTSMSFLVTIRNDVDGWPSLGEAQSGQGRLSDVSVSCG